MGLDQVPDDDVPNLHVPNSVPTLDGDARARIDTGLGELARGWWRIGACTASSGARVYCWRYKLEVQHGCLSGV